VANNLEKTSKYDQKLQGILATAAQVFMEQGYDRASIRMVAERAKVSVAGLYYYVKSKDELLYLIQFHVFDGLVKRFEEDSASVTDPIERLSLFVRNHLEYFLAHLPDLVVCTREIDRLEGELNEQVDGRRRAYFAQALAVVKELIDGRADAEAASAPDVHAGSGSGSGSGSGAGSESGSGSGSESDSGSDSVSDTGSVSGSGAEPEAEIGAQARRPVSARAATLALFGTINWVWTWYQPRSGWTAADMTREFVHLYLHGLLGGGEPQAPVS
jgi:AcrR family transcriptional regulator